MQCTPRLARFLMPGASALLLLGSACTDMPSAPQTYQHVAAGELWTAVSVPPGVPNAQTWMPYIQVGDAREARLQVQEIRRLRGDAAQLRRQGELRSALDHEEQATRLAAASITRTPPASLLSSAMHALERWCTQVEAIPELGSLPALDDAARDVRLQVADARAALALGDTLGAVGILTLAGGAVRDHAPEAVALAAMERVEVMLGTATSRDAVRARHLLDNAREALGAGNFSRAFRRALYALQLAESAAATSHMLPAVENEDPIR